MDKVLSIKLEKMASNWRRKIGGESERTTKASLYKVRHIHLKA